MPQLRQTSRLGGVDQITGENLQGRGICANQTASAPAIIESGDLRAGRMDPPHMTDEPIVKRRGSESASMAAIRGSPTTDALHIPQTRTPHAEVSTITVHCDLPSLSPFPVPDLPMIRAR